MNHISLLDTRVTKTLDNNSAVYGYGSDLHNGHTMMGAAVGLRGSIDTVSYDVFAAMPIRKPEGFHTSDVTSGFSLGVKF